MARTWYTHVDGAAGHEIDCDDLAGFETSEAGAANNADSAARASGRPFRVVKIIEVSEHERGTAPVHRTVIK